MKACVLIEPKRCKVVEVPTPDVGSDDVLIRVRICGVCASEFYRWANGQEAGSYIPGHEPVGVIEAMGPNVKGFRTGERVTCIASHSFAEYVKVDYRRIVRVPEGLDDREALGDPVSCLVSGADRTPVRLGDTVGIVGTGYMGLGFLQLMRLKGAAKIIAVDVREESLANALKFGADIAAPPAGLDGFYRIAETGRMEGGVNVAVEASGTQSGLTLAGEMAGVHGVLSILGYHQDGPRTVDMKLWNWKAITVINAHERRGEMYVRCMESGLALVAAGRLNMKDLVTHELGLEDVDKGFEYFVSKPAGFLKSVVHIGA